MGFTSVDKKSCLLNFNDYLLSMFASGLPFR